MAYSLPQFNLQCNVGPGTQVAVGQIFPVGPPFFFVRVALQVCALVYGRRTNVASTGGTVDPGFPLMAMNLLLPPLSDIRGPESSGILVAGVVDLVEVPAGSGRFYSVCFVDDIGKGWPNEHRTASLLACQGTWPTPAP